MIVAVLASLISSMHRGVNHKGGEGPIKENRLNLTLG